jgi:hypothetical protein
METYLHRGRPYRVQHASTTLRAVELLVVVVVDYEQGRVLCPAVAPLVIIAAPITAQITASAIALHLILGSLLLSSRDRLSLPCRAAFSGFPGIPTTKTFEC